MAAALVDFEAMDDDGQEKAVAEGQDLTDFVVDEDKIEFKPKRTKRVVLTDEDEAPAGPTKRRKRKGPAPPPAEGKPLLDRIANQLDQCEFQEDVHKFQISATNSVVQFHSIVDTMHQNADTELNMIVGPNALHLLSYMYDYGVCCMVVLHRNYFHDYRVGNLDERSRVLILNVATLSHQLDRMKNLDAVSLVMRGLNAELEMKGFCSTEDSKPMILSVKEVDNEPYETVDTKNVMYPVTVQLDAKLFCTAVQQMIGVSFTIKMDMAQGAIVLYSSEGFETFEMPISLGETEVKTIAAHPDVARFSATYHKSRFQPVIKGKKLNNMLRLSFMMKEDIAVPLCIQYCIKDGDNFEVENDSTMTLFVGNAVPDEPTAGGTEDTKQ